MKYEKPQITHVEDASKAVQFMSKEVAIPDAESPSHLPPSSGAYQADD